MVFLNPIQTRFGDVLIVCSRCRLLDIGICTYNDGQMETNIMVTLITSDGGAIRTITESHKNLVAIVMIMDGSDSDHSDNSPVHSATEGLGKQKYHAMKATEVTDRQSPGEDTTSIAFQCNPQLLVKQPKPMVYSRVTSCALTRKKAKKMSILQFSHLGGLSLAYLLSSYPGPRPWSRVEHS